MRNIERIPLVIGKIEQIWKQYPDLRFNQLLFNLCAAYARDKKISPKDLDYAFIEDQDFYDWLKEFKGWN